MSDQEECAILLRKCIEFYRLCDAVEPGRVAVELLNLPPRLSSLREMRKLQRLKRCTDPVFFIRVQPGDGSIVLDGVHLRANLPVCTREFRLKCVCLCVIVRRVHSLSTKACTP